MHLENLKIETNQKYSLDFMKYLPKKNYGDNRILFYSVHDIILLPNERKIVPLELKFAVSFDSVLMLLSNEEIARQNGIQTLQQIISHQNKEFINITLWNTTQVRYKVNKGDIIAYGYVMTSPITYDIQHVKKI